jgi:hypothetical protein
MALAERIGARTAAYVDHVVSRLQDRLAERLIGAWLFGSGSLGDFKPERSDVDIQAVSTECLPHDERQQLAGALSHEALPCPARGLEFVLYAREGLRGPAGPAFQLNLNTGPRMDRHVAFDHRLDPRFWFIIDVSIGRQQGHRLAGAPAEAVLPELPRVLVLGALRDALAWYGANGSAPETVLGACRAWSWISDGRWRSKAESARWARRRLRDPTPIDKALRLRNGEVAPPLTEGELATVLDGARAALGPVSEGA